MNLICIIFILGEERVKLDHDIEKRIDDLKTEFADIAVVALRWLDKRYPKAKDAARWLNEILKGLQSEQLVVPSSSVSNDGTLSDQLSQKWTFTNPVLLQKLVTKIGNEELIERMKQYKENFKCVRRSIPISDQEVTFETFDPRNKCLILILENISDFDDIELFLGKVFDIYKRYLRIHKIEPGCIKVTLQFDASMESHIQACIDKKYEEVKHYAKMYIVSKKEQTETPETHPTGTSKSDRRSEERMDKSPIDKLKRLSGEMLKTCTCIT